jgi:sucrose-phosphate synthase
LDLPPERFLVAGDSGNDADMLAGETLGVVVRNHTPELRPLKNRPRVYFSGKSHAWGILDGIDYYDFFGFIRIPNSTDPTEEIDVACTDAA